MITLTQASRPTSTFKGELGERFGGIDNDAGCTTCCNSGQPCYRFYWYALSMLSRFSPTCLIEVALPYLEAKKDSVGEKFSLIEVELSAAMEVEVVLFASFTLVVMSVMAKPLSSGYDSLVFLEAGDFLINGSTFSSSLLSSPLHVEFLVLFVCLDVVG
ncbi:hypothetical protein SUGI_0391190 [Cryptomeria japonica]|nr:hypothetical protein SUGI_0391190 [Cryptomeria japonica]